MAVTSTDYRTGNLLLSRLSPEQREAFCERAKRVELGARHVLYEPNRPMRHAYFPESGIISVVCLMRNGDSIEVHSIGRDGMAGASLLAGVDHTAYRHFVQVEGSAFQMDAGKLREFAAEHSEFAGLIQRYQTALLMQTMQSVACNGTHSVQQRCCRWLLLAADRSNSEELTVTHEFLALMLGVRRASVTDVLRPLQESGLVSSTRGRITILDRAGLEAGSCECYQATTDQMARILG